MSTVESRRENALHRIVCDASTLSERLTGAYSPVNTPGSARLAQERLAKWRERAAQNDHALFEQRLSWLETTPEKVFNLLGDVRLNGSPPRWSQVLAAAMAACSDTRACTLAPSQPFGKILAPFVQTAVDSLLAPACRAVFSQEILDNLSGDLFRQLSYIAAPTLYLEFSTYRSALGRSEDASPGESRLYETFTANLLEDNLCDFFSQYPALARLLSINTDAWAQNVSEFATALRDDLPDIRRVFGGDTSPERVVAVTPSLSDKHDGGRTVALLEFDNGVRLVYKPRDIGIEQAWFSLLALLNERGGSFHILKVLDREGHGWVEAAMHAPCRDGVEAKNFYVRAGMLLAVLYTLEASDCFFENVVACGAYPVLIDMEMLMHHVFRRSAEIAPAGDSAGDITSGSVLKIGFLPLWETSADGTCIDISGLGARVGRITPYRQRRWLHVNTDAMSLEHEPISVEAESHIPYLDGVPLNAADYTDEIVSGFRQTYELLMRLRCELSGEDNLVEQLGRQEIRILIHATRIYGLLLKRLCAPRHMRSGVERSIETDVFSRFYLGSPDKSGLWPILEAEIACMEQLDIPRFAAAANSQTLPLPAGRKIENAFEETALDRLRRKLSLLSAADLEMQTEFIRASLRISEPSVLHTTSEAVTENRHAQQAALLQPGEFAREADAIAARIERHAIISPDGSATWVAPQPLPGTSHYELRPLRMALYDGLAGVALFFAALTHVSGNGRRIASAALSPLRRFIATTDTSRMIKEGYTLGAANGIGSFVYVLCRCAHFLQSPALLSDARLAAERITPEWIAADDAYDVTSGAAGAILGLLALHEATGDLFALEQAERCGDYLLEKREAAGRGAAWRSINGRFMTGLSHGAAGIALALLRLCAASGARRFRDAADDAIAYEDSVFDEIEGNWPDFRQSPEQPRAFMNTWCHGAPGIGLARLSGLSIQDSTAARRDVEASLCKVSSGRVSDKDGLCCGNLGRVDLLISASARQTSAELERRAVQLASIVVGRSRLSGGYRLSGRAAQDFFDPSFFQGLSGIGYQLLRLAHPGRLPSVLVWE